MPFTGRALALLLLLAPLTTTPDAARLSQQAVATADNVVRPGLEVFVDNVPAALRGKRVGLITNHSAIDRARTPAIDLIARHKDLRLVALFAPEHGIRGDAAAGAKIDDATDAKTGVPIFSLYQSEDRGPTPEMLKDVDVLVYDLQEVGGRTWTYVSTMALSMQMAASKEAAVRGAGSAESDRRRDRRGRAAGSEVQVVRRDVPDSGASRDDGRRARHALQPALRHRRGSHGRACRQLAPFAVAGRYRVCRGSTPRRTSARWPRCRITRDRCTSRAPT